MSESCATCNHFHRVGGNGYCRHSPPGENGFPVVLPSWCCSKYSWDLCSTCKVCKQRRFTMRCDNCNSNCCPEHVVIRDIGWVPRVARCPMCPPLPPRTWWRFLLNMNQYRADDELKKRGAG